MIRSRLLTVVLSMGLLVIPLMATACASDSALSPSPGTATSLTGSLKVFVTDAPPGENVTSIMVKLSEVQVHKALAEQEQEQVSSGNETGEQQPSDNQTGEQEQEQQQTSQSDDGWITISISDNATEFDLLKIKGIEQFLGDATIEAGKYTQVRLVIDTIKVGLNGAEPEEAKLPSNELKLAHSFDSIAGETTSLVIDFVADQMVNVTGAGNIMVKPVIKLTVRQDKPAGKG